MHCWWTLSLLFEYNCLTDYGGKGTSEENWLPSWPNFLGLWASVASYLKHVMNQGSKSPGAIRSTHEYKLGHHEGSEGLRMWSWLPVSWKLNSIHKALGPRSRFMQYIPLARIHAVETRLCISWKPQSQTPIEFSSYSRATNQELFPQQKQILLT